MKIKSGFMLHTVGNENIVVAVEERAEEFHGMIRLNGTGAFLWKQLEDECTLESLTDALIGEYGISQAIARDAVISFLDQLSGTEVIEG